MLLEVKSLFCFSLVLMSGCRSGLVQQGFVPVQRQRNCTVYSWILRLYGLNPARLLSPWGFSDKNTGAGCHFLLQGIFPTQESNLCLLRLLHWQAGSLPLAPPAECINGDYLMQQEAPCWDVRRSQSSPYLYDQGKPCRHIVLWFHCIKPKNALRVSL